MGLFAFSIFNQNLLTSSPLFNNETVPPYSLFKKLLSFRHFNKNLCTFQLFIELRYCHLLIFLTGYYLYLVLIKRKGLLPFTNFNKNLLLSFFFLQALNCHLLLFLIRTCYLLVLFTSIGLPPFTLFIKNLLPSSSY